MTLILPGGEPGQGVANIGRRPTVDERTASLLEVNVFDYAGDLYDAELSVALHAYLRPEQKFSGIEALRTQIALDAAEAQRVLTLL